MNNVTITLTPAELAHLRALLASTTVASCTGDEEARAIYLVYRKLVIAAQG